jgi:hypothetical protein
MGCHRSPGAGAFSVFTHASCGRTVGCVATSAAGTRLAGHVVAGATGQNGAPRRRMFRSARDALGSSPLPAAPRAQRLRSLCSFVLELENNSMLRLFCTGFYERRVGRARNGRLPQCTDGVPDSRSRILAIALTALGASRRAGPSDVRTAGAPASFPGGTSSVTALPRARVALKRGLALSTPRLRWDIFSLLVPPRRALPTLLAGSRGPQRPGQGWAGVPPRAEREGSGRR